MDYPKRGEIHIVNLDPTIGAEIKKTRPEVVISNDINNKFSATITVLPVTDKGKRTYPFEVNLPVEQTGLKKESKVKCQQIRTVDKRRLVKIFGTVGLDILQKIEQGLMIHLGIEV